MVPRGHHRCHHHCAGHCAVCHLHLRVGHRQHAVDSHCSVSERGAPWATLAPAHLAGHQRPRWQQRDLERDLDRPVLVFRQARREPNWSCQVRVDAGAYRRHLGHRGLRTRCGAVLNPLDRGSPVRGVCGAEPTSTILLRHPGVGLGSRDDWHRDSAVLRRPRLRTDHRAAGHGWYCRMVGAQLRDVA